MKPKHNENFVYQAVLAGDIEIMQDGTIWRTRHRFWNRRTKQMVTTPCTRRRAELDQGKYFQVRAMVAGVRAYALAHRLVWLHFNGPIPGDLTINHKDGIKKNNDPRNMELATNSEQALHCHYIIKTSRWAKATARSS